VYGEQEGAAYNGHFSSVCYHPLFVFNQFGDCEGANLRPGNVHSAHDWREVLEPVMARYERSGVAGTSGPMRPLPDRRSMSIWKSRASCTPLGSPVTGYWSGRFITF